MNTGLQSAEEGRVCTGNQFRDSDIWAEAKTEIFQILLFSPDSTTKVARPRVGYFVVDEIHLVYEWGLEFRSKYAMLATMRARLPEWTVFVGLTVTLEPGRETDRISRIQRLVPFRETCVNVTTLTST